MIIRDVSVDNLEPVLTPLWFPDEHGHQQQAKGYVVPDEFILDNISRDHPMWSRLVTRIISKGQTRVLVPALDNDAPDDDTVRDLKYCFLGDHSVYEVRGKGFRYMPVSWNGIGNSELARTYLQDCLDRADGQVLRNPRRYAEYAGIVPPQFYVGGRHHDDMAYIDLSQAYWTIQKNMTLDMRFEVGSHILLGHVPFRDIGEVTAYRGLRHGIPGSTHVKTAKTFRFGELHEMEIRTGGGKSLWFPGLYGFTQHVMHSVAHHMVDQFQAWMVLVDGYIIPARFAEAAQEFLLDYWGLCSVVKGIGEGAVYGQGCYRVGGKGSQDSPQSWTLKRRWEYRSKEGVVHEMIADERPVNKLVVTDGMWLHQELRALEGL